MPSVPEGLTNLLILVALAFACSSARLYAQSEPGSPVISGAAGFFGTNNAGNPSWQPVIQPVALMPIGDHILVESRGEVGGFISRRDGSSGPYQGQFFSTLDYLQLDYTFSKSVTLVAGRFLTPFGIYNERFTSIWIQNLPDTPLIFPIGTRTSGSSDGAMLRTSIGGHNDKWQLDVTAFASAGTQVNKFEAGRAAGTRLDLLLPNHALEFGASYERYLEGIHSNAIGAHFSWTPRQSQLQLRSEYAHSNSGQGYWIEAAYRGLGQVTRKPNSVLSRLQPVLRVQQFYRDQLQPNDLLPTTNTTQGDFGLNYYLPHDVRFSSSFGRQFATSGDHNVWNIALTYRFTMPVPIGGNR